MFMYLLEKTHVDDSEDLSPIDLLALDSAQSDGFERVMKTTHAAAALDNLPLPTTTLATSSPSSPKSWSPPAPSSKQQSCSPLAINESRSVFNHSTSDAEEILLLLDGMSSTSSLSSPASTGHHRHHDHANAIYSSSISSSPSLSSIHSCDYPCDGDHVAPNSHLSATSTSSAEFPTFSFSDSSSSSHWSTTTATATNQPTRVVSSATNSLVSATSGPNSAREISGSGNIHHEVCRHNSDSAIHQFLSPLELRRKRNRESMQRARLRQKETLEHLKQQVEALECKYESLCAMPSSSTSQSPSRRPPHFITTSRSINSDNSNSPLLKLREIYALAECVKALRQENLVLRQEIDEQEKLGASILETCQEEELGFGIHMVDELLWNDTINTFSGVSTISDNRNTSSGSLRRTFAGINHHNSERAQQLVHACSYLVRQVDTVLPALPRPSMASSRANTVMVDAMTEVDSLSYEQGLQLVQDSWKEFEQLVERLEYTTVKNHVLGWREKWQISDTTTTTNTRMVHYLLEKEIPDVDATKIVDDTWQLVQCMDQWRAKGSHRHPDMATIQVVQVINDDMYVCMRERIVPQESTSTGLELVAKTVFLRYRMKTERGFVIGRKALFKNHSDSDSDSDACAQLLIEVTPLVDPTRSDKPSGCNLRIGALVDFSTQTNFHQRLLQLLVLVLSWENMMIGPILKLP